MTYHPRLATTHIGRAYRYITGVLFPIGVTQCDLEISDESCTLTYENVGDNIEIVFPIEVPDSSTIKFSNPDSITYVNGYIRHITHGKNHYNRVPMNNIPPGIAVRIWDGQRLSKVRYIVTDEDNKLFLTRPHYKEQIPITPDLQLVTLCK